MTIDFEAHVQIVWFRKTTHILATEMRHDQKIIYMFRYIITKQKSLFSRKRFSYIPFRRQFFVELFTKFIIHFQHLCDLNL